MYKRSVEIAPGQGIRSNYSLSSSNNQLLITNNYFRSWGNKVYLGWGERYAAVVTFISHSPDFSTVGQGLQA